jgi:SAM-dependent methyltransferase
MQNVSFNNGGARQFERRPYLQSVDFSMSSRESREKKWLNGKAKAIDISDGGIGIQTDIPLEPGHMLWFNDGTEDKAGLVQWCIKHDDDYRVGVKLDGKHIKHLDIATDLFMKRLQEVENKCNTHASDADPDTIYKEVNLAISDVLESCEEFESEVMDEKIIRDARVRFMEQTNPILSKSYLINRARTWPQGYQGDYKMLESIYRNTPLSKGIGYYLDLYCLNLPIAVAGKNRIKKLEEVLRTELLKKRRPSIINIACGSCREVFELAPDIEKTGAKFTCIDFDDDALSFAADRLSFTSISPLFSNQVKFRKYNALRMFDHELNMSEFGKKDIIYSVGFFDYLNSDFIITMLESLYEMLNHSGKMIIPLPDANKYRHQDFNWIVDWDGVLQRSEEDYKNIFSNANLPDSSISETSEDSGIFTFYTITKRRKDIHYLTDIN